ncbi:NepR family anti-sigma factor [Belnapia rosea]|nr:NepR family anti-sigma factor [Belnapia rosea]
MGKTEKKRANTPAKPGIEQEGEEVDQAFDVWLRRGLHQLYDTVAREPIPEDLLRLIEEDRASEKK